MAAFASDRRSGWVRFFVVLLCALFILSTLGAPAARAEALTVGLFTAAAVLSAATAALGFKLSNSAEGQATLAKMVQDFKVSATAVGLVLVGSKINGLIDGIDYIKMQVKAGKTYLDERVVAWVQQWLAQNGVYDSGLTFPEYNTGDVVNFNSFVLDDVVNAFSVYSDTYNVDPSIFGLILKHENLDISDGHLYNFKVKVQSSVNVYYVIRSKYNSDYSSPYTANGDYISNSRYGPYQIPAYNYRYFDGTFLGATADNLGYLYYSPNVYNQWIAYSPCFGIAKSNNIGLSGTDTLGKDVIDLTLDQVLQQLKDWAPDWWDAGADSSTNGAAAGAKDLPLNMGSDVKTVTGNPALEVDQPLIYTPWFEETLDNLRNGETAGTVTNTATSAADTAEKAEAAEGTVEDAQGVVQSLINWGLDYISPDKGLFSRFPLCIPYDAYLLVTAALGVDAQDLGEIVGQSPGELSAQVDDGVVVQSDFVPVISVKHDWTQDGVTTPVEVTIDLRPYDGVIKMIRTLVSVYVIAELIASEYKRIRGS